MFLGGSDSSSGVSTATSINKNMNKEETASYGGAVSKFQQGGAVYNINNSIKKYQQGGSTNNITSLDSTSPLSPASESNVVVNVSGNLLTSEYVEGELAEAIQTAARRGVDFS